MLKWVKRLAKYVLLPLVLALIGFVAGALIYRESAQREIADRRAITAPEGIDIIEAVNIGGVDQWLSIRGQNRNAPILLYVHGGPGSTMMPFAHAFQDPLEHNFVVVQWDQRGTGKSRTGSDDLDGVTIDRMVEDVIEVSNHLREKFGREKIVLLGHSWGSVLGVHAVKRAPELYSAYIGVGQVVNMQDNERVTYEYSLEEARRRNDAEGIAALEALAPYPDPDMEAFVQKVGVQRTWLIKYDASLRVPGGIRTLLGQLFVSPDYSLRDISNFFAGSMGSINHFWGELIEVDLPALGTDFEVPMFIISGTHDYQVPFELAEAWFDGLNAPYKEFLWVPGAAHMPMNSHPEDFASLLVRRVLPTIVKTESPQSARLMAN